MWTFANMTVACVMPTPFVRPPQVLAHVDSSGDPMRDMRLQRYDISRPYHCRMWRTVRCRLSFSAVRQHVVQLYTIVAGTAAVPCLISWPPYL